MSRARIEKHLPRVLAKSRIYHSSPLQGSSSSLDSVAVACEHGLFRAEQTTRVQFNQLVIKTETKA